MPAALPLAECLTRVERTARGIRQPWLDQAEMTAVGNLALTRCLAAWEPARGEFWPWALLSVRGAMIDALRSWKGRTHRLDWTDIAELEAAGREPAAPQRDLDLEMDLRAALAQLRPRLAEVFLRHALGGESLTEIGRGWGVTESRACQLYSEARRQLRAALEAQPAPSPAGHRLVLCMLPSVHKPGRRPRRRPGTNPRGT